MSLSIGVKTDYSLLQSLIKIPDLIDYLNKNKIDTCGILDDNLFSTIAFYKQCKSNNIKPIIGLIVGIGEYKIYLYPTNYEGYLNLLKINTLKQSNEISYMDLKQYNKYIIAVIPFKYNMYFEQINNLFDKTYISYSNDYEKTNSLILSENLVYISEIVAFKATDIKYINYLREIDTGIKNDYTVDLSNSYLNKELSKEDIESITNFVNLINIEIPTNNRYIPHYDNTIKDSYEYLENLCKKGLYKRCNGNVTKEYSDRLFMELKVIKDMGFVDYFLIVYDYVKYAKTHDILVGPGRGSAAGSLVSYSIGITNVDPIKYDLLFERFLNPERVTMPDIDIDFEYTKRDLVIDYVKNRYGEDKVANIMTYGTLGARQVIRDVGKCLDINSTIIDKLSNLINPKLSLKENLEKNIVKEYIVNNNLKNLYNISYKLEGLKRQISTHAAGVVISSETLDEIIPICINDNQVLTGTTMEYLEELGLIKMDFLALRNLTIIKNVLDLIEEKTKKKIDLSKIPLDDNNTLDLFRKADTEGIFQYESSGMKNLLSKMKPDNFLDVVAAVALFRPGPMQNIDHYINKKKGKEKIDYYDDSLIDILKDTYGIMIYQEQIMQVLVTLADYSFAEADNIRRAMSKKKVEVMDKEKDKFVERVTNKGMSKDKAIYIFDTIAKFAGYGFNKAHSVSYGLIGYQMAYLKANYPVYFIANLLNMSIGSDIKTKEYIDEAKKNSIKIYKPSINVSTDNYLIHDNSLLLPLNVIHNVGSAAVKDILDERNTNGKYTDYLDFIARTYGKSVNRRTIESLIDGDTFRDFNLNHKTLFNNIDSALDYALLCNEIDKEFVMKPNIEIEEEYTEVELMNKELSVFGYYVTNHPAAKYVDVVKIEHMKEFFDKYIDLVVIIGSIRKISTKKGEDMGFFSGSDETGITDFVIFPKNNKYLYEIHKDDLVKVRGQVTRRVDKYQIVVSNLEIIK